MFNFKGLNEFVCYNHFKMDNLETGIKLLRPGCFMTSIDLKDAYYSIPVAPECQKYLKFVWKETLYCFTCLRMSLTSSPRIFTKVLKPVFTPLRTKFGHELNLLRIYTQFTLCGRHTGRLPVGHIACCSAHQ